MGSNYFEFFKSSSMENNFGIQQHDNFYFGAPPTDFAILGASSSPEFQYETPMTGNSDFGRALASDFGASMADFGAYATDLGASPSNFESPPLIQPMSSDFPPTMSYHYEAPPPMSTNYGGQPINDSSEQSFMSSQGESFYQDSLYQDSNFGVHQQSNTNFGYSSSRSVLVKIHAELYPISHEVLDWFFSGIGKLESIERFDQWNPFHSRLCFQDSDSAVRAVQWLDGSCIYNGCCQVELILEAETIDRANEMDASNQQIFEDFRIDEPVRQNPDFSIVDELQDSLEGVEDPINDAHRVDPKTCIEDPSEAENSSKDLSLQESCKSMVDIIEQMRGTLREMADELRQWREEIEAKGSIDVESPIEEAEDAKTEASIEGPNQEIKEVPRELQIQFRSSEVNSYLPNPIVVDIVWKERDELVDASIGIRWTDFRMNSSYCLSFPSAHQVFVKMSAKDVSLTDGASEHVNGFSKISRDCLKNFVAYKIFAKIPRRDVWVFDPGIAEILVVDSIDSIEIGIADFGETAYKLFDEMPSRGITVMGREYWKFDPGDVDSSKFAGSEQTGYQLWHIIFKFYDVLILVFDPGISEWVIFYQH